MRLAAVWPTRAARVAAGVCAALAAALFSVVVMGQAEWAGRIATKVAHGRKPRLEDYVFDGQWHAAVVSVGLCLALALTARFWTGGGGGVRGSWGGPTGRRLDAGRWSRWFWVVVVLAVVAAAWVRLPRLELSLYNDEAYAFRRYVAGEHKRMPDETREWRPVTWMVTLWGNQMANNGVPYSLLSRAAYDLSVACGSAVATLPAEIPLRLPAILAGLGSVVVMALLGRRLASPAAGMVAAALAAVHPWHVRYSTEARGHSFILLLAPMLPLALMRAVESGRWWWWAAFGAIEVVLLWSFAGALYYLLAFNFLALIWLCHLGGVRWRTFLAVHVMAAMVYLHLMAPCLPQMREALVEIPIFTSGLSRSWGLTTGSFLLTGMPWFNANPNLPDHPSLQRLWSEHPMLLAGWMATVLAVLAAGARRAWATPIGRIVTLSLPLAAGLAVAASLVGKTVLFTWYVLYLLPGGLVLAGLGLVEVMEFVWRGAGWGRWAAMAVVAGGLAGWVWLIASPLATYRHMGKQALREVAQILRAPVDGEPPLGVVYRSEASVYYPGVLAVDGDPASLRALAARADTEARSLVIAIGYPPLVAVDSADFLAVIEGSGEFERIAYFPGLEEAQFAHHVWRRRPVARAPRESEAGSEKPINNP